MSDLQIFQNEQFGSVRTIENNSKIYFCGSDVAKALGYARPNDAVSAHCRGTVKHRIGVETGIKANGEPAIQNIEMCFIPEGDVYRLITHSKLPAAEQFEHWVFDEVLPDIRKHGLYATDELLNNPDFLIQAITALKEEREKRKLLETETALQKQQIAELQPKASYYDVVLNCKDLLSITEIAKDYGKSGTWLNKKLHELNVQFKQGKIWLLYQKYAEKGYTSTKTHTYPANDGEVHTKVHTYWTQKGRLFIYELLKAEGILPLIEQEESEEVKESA